MTTAFDPIDVAGMRLANRIAMAPMTRSRAGAGGIATDLMVEYYSQRASAGLIITEGVQPSVVGQGYPWTPGLHSDEQIASWRKVTDAVHAKGGRIFAQIMHTGRVGHPVLLPEGMTPVAPSAIAAQGQVFTAEGMKEFITPRELTEDEILATVTDFVTASRNAIEAGFDGVELHGANGYLIHQFLAPNSNHRTDRWGGSVENRIRFAVEVVRAVVAEIGADKTGLRISPSNALNTIEEPEPAPVYTALVDAIEPLGLAYLHILESTDIRELTLDLRKRFTGTLILNALTEGPTGPDALHLIEDGITDVLSYGFLFVANPDLPARLKAGGPFNTPDPTTLYGGDAKGYTDYPTLAQ
ncbi:alkene reductase [Streptomyces triculaminicus]|uniref:Alkene reductase n=2 Tax=Streptomyces TaxID=1883 RepID=A0A939FL58_9ACTN|nr:MULTISPECIES: alkene reductase [Streptomyces]MBO0651835.1 alkene reductase [Streptomyces triculaminicus]QSY47241.1 alkene reductase [Streptomyces griseocarneus]